MDELHKYFSGSGWKVRESKGLFEASSEFVEAEALLDGAQFAWRVEATDDPSDYDEGVSDEPVKAIAKFIGGPIPGGEFFEKMAFQPSDMSWLLRRMASAVDAGKVGSKRLAAVLRRAQVLPGSDCLRKLASVVHAAAEGDLESEEVGKLKQDMESKGWKVSETETGSGLPALEVDVSGTFTATIEVESISWKYRWQFKDRPELEDEGVTDDPIRDFQTWYRTDEFQEAKGDYEEEKKSRKLGEQETVPPSDDERQTDVPRTQREMDTEAPTTDRDQDTVRPGQSPAAE